MARIPNEQAAERTFERLASEAGGTAYLSADIVATDDHDRPVVSVIHLDDRRHWNLTVDASKPWKTRDITVIRDLPEALALAEDGAVLHVVTEDAAWQLAVTVLPPAKV